MPAYLITALLLLLTIPPRLSAAEPVPGRLTDNLTRTFAEKAGTDTISVIIYLQDDLDLAAMDNQLTLASAGKKKRHETVIAALQSTAAESQTPIISLLERGIEGGAVIRYRSFWINNTIAVTGTVGFLADLSTKSGIDWMTLDRVRWLELGPEKRGAGINASTHPDTLRAKSYPIRSLGLDGLWDKGLTGKGILVCAIGSGIDGSHEMLSPKWRGHNGASAEESWFDPISGSNFPFDDEPNSPTHGTSVMGIMVAGERTLGVAYDAQWIGAKVFDNQNLTNDGASTTKDSWLIAAFQWAADPDGNPETTVDVPDVINNSWGTLGEYSEDICQEKLWLLIDRIEAAGTVVLFSAGNEGPDLWSIGSPASRAVSPVNAFAVGSVDSLGKLSPFSSRGPSACDSIAIKPNICAPGQEVFSIVGSQYLYKYTYLNGTSFAAPYVAGLVALIKQANPTLTPDEIKTIIQETAADAGQPGPDYGYGYGVINPEAIFERVGEPEFPVIYTKNVELTEAIGDGNGYIDPGETINFVVPVYNSGSAASDLNVTLATDNPAITIEDGEASYGNIERLGSGSNEDDPFIFSVALNTVTGSQLVFRLYYTANGGEVSDSFQVTLTIAPPVENLRNHSAGSFLFSFTNYGQYGGNIGQAHLGQGLRYPGNAPYTMLHRASLLVGTSSLKVSDGIHDFDFAPAPGGPIKMLTGSARADEIGIAYIREKNEGQLNSIGVRIKQTSMVWKDAPDNDFVILEYKVANPYTAAIQGLYIGIYADWDIPDSLPTRNAVLYDQEMKLGYSYNPQQPQFGAGGLMLLGDSRASGHRAVRNADYIHQGYSDNAIFSFMSGGFTRAEADSLDDWSQILSSGPHTIPAGDTLTVAWAFVVGDNIADLLTNAAAAATKYDETINLAAETAEQVSGAPGLPKAFSLAQNHPNPFNPGTTIEYIIPDDGNTRRVSLNVYDIRGKLVATLVNAEQSGGSYSVEWNGTDRNGSQVASGVYFYRISADEFTSIRKMVLLK